MKYDVTFTFGGCIQVDAACEEEAEDIVAGKSDNDLWEICKDGFDIQRTEEAR